MKILIIEDDADVLRFIKKGLSESGYTIDAASTGDEGLFLATTQYFDLMILDVMLPELSGFDIIKRIRKNHIKTPVIFLTARDDQDDILQGFNLGADDYLVKPFSFAELLARIKAILRRGHEKPIDKLCIGDLSLDLIKHTVYRGHTKIEISAKEFLLLEYLLRNSGQVLTRTMILEQVWGYSFDTSSNIIDVHINRLRGKIDKHFNNKLIHTIKGVGYVLKAEE
ncbi:heavy metal response regulator transcription factor [Desulfobacula phenolica]|uniref:Two component transcriptional regulator, winged helix family n=1 Tax=Desulfobacula phenolica TaxID=90732 RepID=A0A1H2GPZ7_9BACT|nr:response regulator transcription factor [Desulfobacula phenolica]SDU21667.1 two component transcriptional regulator, winged helix family [Desulfobacula phenolica]